MPVRNEASFIDESLGAVLDQDYPEGSFEVIVADGMSTDGTREIVGRFVERFPNLRLVDNPGGTAPKALNAGFAVARGEIIIRVDGHCRVGRDYVSRCVEHLLNDGVDGVGGPVITVGTSFMSNAIAAAMGSVFGVGGSNFRTRAEYTGPADTVPFPAYTRKIMVEAGPYDEELVRNQDDEYNYRLRESGARILLAADLKSTYYSRSSLGALSRQFFQYGLWKVRVFQKHPAQMRPRQFVPLLLVLGIVGGAMAALIFPGLWFPWCAGVTTYLVAALVAALAVAFRSDLRYLVVLPAAYAIMHCAYGSGFAVGMIKFVSFWPPMITGVFRRERSPRATA